MRKPSLNDNKSKPKLKPKSKPKLKAKPKPKLNKSEDNPGKFSHEKTSLSKLHKKSNKASKELILKPVTVKPPKYTSKYKLLGSQIKPNAPPEGSDIYNWNMELREFIKYSNNHWKSLFPRFRENYQGDKLEGYAICKDYVDIPRLYCVFDSVSQITLDHLRQITKISMAKSGKQYAAFVIKETLGHTGNKVICLRQHPVTKLYRDLLHHSDYMTFEQIPQYIRRKLTPQTRVIVEEFLGTDTIPPDYKVYVIGGKVRAINIYFRLDQGRFEMSFRPNWERVPIKELYYDLITLNYQDLPDRIPFTLPPPVIRDKLLKTALKLAHLHSAKFVRYDFYCVGDRIVLGEITPLCGGFRNNFLRQKMLEYVFPTDLREAFKNLHNL